MACAPTGSGKTAAYLFPVLAKMLEEGPPSPSRQRQARPVSLVLAPTRELAVQIYEETLKFVHATGVKTAVIYGGTDARQQSYKLDRGVDILIATPGRLIDFVSRCKVSLTCVRYLVIDEADRMLDMGFETQIRTILENEDMPQRRDTVMVSATFPKTM